MTGSLRMDAPTYVLGAPMLLEIEVKNPGPGPLAFDTLSANTAWVVRDDSNAVVCNGGGASRLGSEFVEKVELAAGDTHRETRLLNRGCDAFTRPGRYRVSIVRLVHQGQPGPRGCETLLPVASDAAPSDVECAKSAPTYPAIADDAPIEILPWDAKALGERLSRVEAREDYADWYCAHVRCSCPPYWERQGKWVEKALAKVPSKMGEGCR